MVKKYRVKYVFIPQVSVKIGIIVKFFWRFKRISW